MTKFPILHYNTKNTKSKLVPPPMPPSKYEDVVGWPMIEASYKQALRGHRKFSREAVCYDLLSEVNNVELWSDLKKIESRPQPGRREYSPGPYRHRTITEPKTRSLHIPHLRDKVVQLVIHEELQNLFRPVFVDRSFACMYGKGPIRAAFNVQHDMRVARMKWGDEVAVIKIDVKKFFYSIDRQVLKKIIAKRFKKLKKKYPDKYEDFLRFYRLLCKVIDSSPEGETGIPSGMSAPRTSPTSTSTSSTSIASASSVLNSTLGTWTTSSSSRRTRRSPGSGWQRSRYSSRRGSTLRPTKRPRFSMCGRA